MKKSKTWLTYLVKYSSDPDKATSAPKTSEKSKTWWMLTGPNRIAKYKAFQGEKRIIGFPFNPNKGRHKIF